MHTGEAITQHPSVEIQSTNTINLGRHAGGDTCKCRLYIVVNNTFSSDSSHQTMLRGGEWALEWWLPSLSHSLWAFDKLKPFLLDEEEVDEGKNTSERQIRWRGHNLAVCSRGVEAYLCWLGPGWDTFHHVGSHPSFSCWEQAPLLNKARHCDIHMLMFTLNCVTFNTRQPRQWWSNPMAVTTYNEER